MDRRSFPEVSNNSTRTQDSGYHTQGSSTDDQDLFDGSQNYVQSRSGQSERSANPLDDSQSLIPYSALHTALPNFGNPGFGNTSLTNTFNQGHAVPTFDPLCQFPEQAWGIQTNSSITENFNGSSISTIPGHSNIQGINLSGYSLRGQYMPLDVAPASPSNARDYLHSGGQPSPSSSTSKAETWAKFWIEQNPGKFPCDQDRVLLATLAKENSDALGQAFAKFLSSGAIQGQRSENRDAFNTARVRSQDPNRGPPLIIDPKHPRAAAQWIASQEISCPPWQDELGHTEETRSWKYRCTLGCGRPFEKKDGWVSHEKLCYQQSGWVCGLDKTFVMDDTTYCSYCGLGDPELGHFESEHSEYAAVGPCCENLVGNGTNRTIFDRRYRFLNHMKQVHPNLPIPQGKILAQSYFTVASTFDRICSICLEYEFRNWDDRIRHLARHFEGPPRFPKQKRPPKDDDDTRDDDDDPKDDDDDPKDDGDHFDDTSRPPVKKLRHGNNANTSKDGRQNSSQSGGTVDDDSMRGSSSDPIERRYKPSGMCRPSCYDTSPVMNTVHASSRTFISSFRQQLLEAKVAWADTDSRSFVPIDCLERICTRENISNELSLADCCASRCDQDGLIEYIQTSAKKTFAILSFIGHSNKVEALMRENFSDANLPIPAKEGSFIGTSSGAPSVYRTLLQLLKRHGVDEFYQTQWSFLAPVFEFKPKVSHYELDNNCILPFIKEDRDGSFKKREGGYSEVWPVRIHPAHQKLYDDEGQEEVTYDHLIAVKRLRSNDTEAFEAEVAMLKQFSVSNHRHLIKLLATYHFQNSYHLTFFHADQNLSSFLRMTEPLQTFSYKIWVLEQLKGLASGLALIHGSHEISEGREKPKYGLHLDLKPDNILIFASASNGNTKGGLWKISDFGTSKLRERDSRSRIDPASIGYTPAYAPPEVSLKQPISQAYDVWSFGCVLIQCLAWYTAGCTAGDDLMRSQMQSSNPKEQGLFTILDPGDGNHPQAIIKESVPRLMQQLRTHPQSSEFVDEMLALIEVGMLVIDPKKRWSASAIERALGRMVERAKVDVTYMSPKPNSEKMAEPDGSLNAKSNLPRTLDRYSKKISEGFKSIRSLVSTRSGNRGSVNGVHQGSP